MFWDIPGGPLVENPLPNAGDTGSIPSLGRSHMPWSNWAQAPQLLSTCSRVPELQLLKPVCLEPALCNIGNHRSKKSTHHNEKQPLLLQLAKAHTQQRRSSAAKIKYINIYFFNKKMFHTHMKHPCGACNKEADGQADSPGYFLDSQNKCEQRA